MVANLYFAALLLFCTYAGYNLGFSLFPPLGHFGVDLFSYFRLDLTGISYTTKKLGIIRSCSMSYNKTKYAGVKHKLQYSRFMVE